MHAVVRTYSGSGAKDLFGLLEKRKADAALILFLDSGPVALMPSCMICEIVGDGQL